MITRAEVLVGFDDAALPLALELIDQFPALTVTADIADHAVRLRCSGRWKFPDALQAAIAMIPGQALVTRNS